MRLMAGTPIVRELDVSEPGAAGVANARSEVRLGADEVDPRLNVDLGAARVFAPIRDRIDAFNRLPRDVKSAQVTSGLFRYAPYAAIALLPLFAGLLALAYAGGARRHPGRPQRYAAHLVFGAHLHAFAFLVAMLVVVVPWPPLRLALELCALVYALVALKAVYGGGWTGVTLRATLIGFFYLLLFVIATVAVVAAAVLLR
jgi:hypothetical protein